MPLATPIECFITSFADARTNSEPNSLTLGFFFKNQWRQSQQGQEENGWRSYIRGGGTPPILPKKFPFLFWVGCYYCCCCCSAASPALSLTPLHTYTHIYALRLPFLPFIYTQPPPSFGVTTGRNKLLRVFEQHVDNLAKLK